MTWHNHYYSRHVSHTLFIRFSTDCLDSARDFAHLFSYQHDPVTDYRITDSYGLQWRRTKYSCSSFIAFSPFQLPTYKQKYCSKLCLTFLCCFAVIVFYCKMSLTLHARLFNTNESWQHYLIQLLSKSLSLTPNSLDSWLGMYSCLYWVTSKWLKSRSNLSSNEIQ